MNIANILFFSFVALKPFYFFPSGGIGVADWLLVLTFVVIFANKVRQKDGRVGHKEDIYIYIFLACAIVINIWYYIHYRNRDLLLNTSYWVYSVMVVWCFREIACKKNLDIINKILKVSFLIQVIIYISGIGRLYYEWWGAVRYMGTFNNPNQMAYVIFLMLLLIYLYDFEHKKKDFWLYALIAGFLILLTKSTGVFVGWFLLIVGILFSTLYCTYKKNEKSRRTIILCSAVLMIIIVGSLLVIWPNGSVNIQDENLTLITRLQSKIALILEGGLRSVVIDRGGEKILYYPQYLLFGAGEGAFERFSMAVVWKSEIHSTIFSIWFSYGIVPTVLLGVWLYRNHIGIPHFYWAALAALFIESLTVINYRQPFFWMILIYFGVTRSVVKSAQIPKGKYYDINGHE